MRTFGKLHRVWVMKIRCIILLHHPDSLKVLLKKSGKMSRMPDLIFSAMNYMQCIALLKVNRYTFRGSNFATLIYASLLNVSQLLKE